MPSHRHIHVLLAGCAIAAGACVTPALAGCNSGNTADGNLLSSSYCQASASTPSATAVGSLASSGDASTALGYRTKALGNEAVAIGDQAGSFNPIAGAVFIGTYAGSNLDAGVYSTAIGSGSQGEWFPSALGAYSIALGGGDGSGGGAFTGATANGPFSIAIGTGAFALGTRSTAVGAFAGSGASGASTQYNSAFGDEAGVNISGQGNTGIGLAAGYAVSGDLNTGLGNSAGQRVTGSNNTAGGVGSGSTVQGGANAAYGVNAGQNVTGNNNVAIGANAGRSITVSNTIAIGSGALGRATDTVAIGDSAVASRARSVALGSSSVANAPDTVSVGSPRRQRRIVNVGNAVDPTDAVNLRQVQALVAAASRPAAARSVALLGIAPASSAVSSRGGSASDPQVAVGRPGASRDSDSQRMSNPSPKDAAAVSSARAGGAQLEPSAIAGWANVNRNGTLAEARNVVGNARHSAGEYEIAFQQPLRHCTYHATLADFGFVSVRPGPEVDSLTVQTRNHFGALTDADFSLIVVC